MTRVVRPGITVARALWMASSEIVSRALVASSKMKKSCSPSRARAIASLNDEETRETLLDEIQDMWNDLQSSYPDIAHSEDIRQCLETILESEEIKIHKPILNRAQRKTRFDVSLYSHKNAEGYLTLKLQKTDGRKREITSFTSPQEAKNALFNITARYHLCQKLTGLYETKSECFQYKIKECNGACIGLEPANEYNARVEQFIANHTFKNETMVVVDRGRKLSERSAILIENGNYKGYCFFDLNYQISTLEILQNILIPMGNNRDVKNIIQGHIRRKKYLKIINL